MTIQSLGFLFALACAVTNAGLDVTQKKALAGRPLLATIVALRFTVFAFMTLLILIRHVCGYPLPWQVVTADMFRTTPHFLVYSCADCGLVALSAMLYYRALQVAPLSVTVPFLAFTPVFLMFSQWLVLRQTISLSGVEGVAVVVFGSALMHRSRFQFGWLEPVRALARERGSRYMLLVALLLALTNVLEKWLVVRSGNFTFAWIYAAVSFCLFALALLAISFQRDASFQGLRWPMILLGGTLDGTTLLLQYEAFLYLSPVTTISFKRGGILLTVLAGWFFFKEAQIAERLIAAAIMICGALMLYLKFTTLQQSLLVTAAVIVGLAAPRMLRHTRQASSPAAAVLFLLPMIFLATHLSAQQQEPSNPVGRLEVTTRLVILDIVVTDHSGNLRNDLHREDFQITENGVGQTITSFEPPAAHETPTGLTIQSTAELEQMAPQSPVNIVVLDEFNTAFQDMDFARYALKKFLATQANREQAPTMLIAASEDRFQVLQDYTQESGAILSALNRHLTAYPWHLQTGVNRVQQLALSLATLEQIAKASAGHPGHKNLIWIGRGFPGVNLTSPGLAPVAVAVIRSAFRSAIDMLRDARVTLYTVDPTALSATVAVHQDGSSVMGEIENTTGEDPFAADAQFTAIASATGGKSFYSRNDVDREIAESVRDGVNYYTIAYHPTADIDSAKPFRHIAVHLSVPGLVAQYRDGYYPRNSAEAAPSALQTTFDLHAAEQSTLVYTGLSVTAVAKPDAPGVYLLGVPEDQLSWSPDSNSEISKLTLVTVSLDAKGRILQRVTSGFTERRPSSTSTAYSSGSLVRLESQMLPVKSATRIRFVLQSESDGRIGTADILLNQ